MNLSDGVKNEYYSTIHDKVYIVTSASISKLC